MGGRRRLATVQLDLAAIKRIGRAQGATVNDVILALVSAGLSELLAGRGESLPVLQSLVPVSLRHPDDRGSLGNQVTAPVVRLPIGDRAPAARALGGGGGDHQGEVRDRRCRPRSPAAVDRHLADAAADVGRRPHPSPALRERGRHERAGPQQPLELLGAELTEIVPIVPLGGNLTMGVAVFSYRGRLAVGLHADADALPDLDVVVSGIERTFAELA